MYRQTVLVASLVILSLFAQSGAHPHSAHPKVKGEDNPDVTIQNRVSKLVLDGSGNYVLAENDSGVRSQVWRKEPRNDGNWAFINSDNGLFMDIEGGQAVAGAKLVTKEHDEMLTQEWIINSDGTIVSAANKSLAITIAADATSGSPVTVEEVAVGGAGQAFDLIIISE